MLIFLKPIATVRVKEKNNGKGVETNELGTVRTRKTRLIKRSQVCDKGKQIFVDNLTTIVVSKFNTSLTTDETFHTALAT